MRRASSIHPREGASSGAITYGHAIYLDVFILVWSVVMCVGAIGAIRGDGDAAGIFSFLPFDIAAWGWIALCCSAGFTALRNALDRRPRLVLSADGLLARMPMAGEFFLKWPEIQDVHDRGFGSIYIELGHPAAFASRMGPLGRLWMRINRLTGRAPVMLNGILLRAPSSEVIAEIRRRLDQPMLADVRERRRREIDLAPPQEPEDGPARP